MGSMLEGKTYDAIPPGDVPSVVGGKSGHAEETTSQPSAIRNALTNWIGFGAEVVVAFLLTPYLIRHLGSETYGVWFLIGSLAGYFGMLDFGFGSSIGRFIALYRGQNDHPGILRTLTTSAAILGVIGGISSMLVLASSYGLHWIFREIPTEELPHARLALVIVGANLGLNFLFTTFDSALWGYERFDLKNLVDVLATVIRAMLAAVLVSWDWGLEGLAWSTFAVTLVAGGAKFCLCWHVARPFHLSWGAIQLSTIRELAPFGFWQFVLSSSRIARLNINPILVGAMLGPVMVTAFSLTTRLVGYAGMALMTTVNVVAPRLASFVGQNDLTGQHAMMLKSGRICCAFSTYVVSAMILFGQSFLRLWVGSDLDWAWVILAVLAAGEWLPMVVQPYNLAVFVNARQRAVAWRGAAECVLGLALGGALGWWWGLVGFAAAVAVAATWFRGMFMLRYAGEILGIETSVYLRQAVMPVVLRSVLPIVMMAMALRWYEPANWPQFLSCAIVFTVGFTLVLGPVLVDSESLGSNRVARAIAALMRAT